jgi:hypothetical protein
MVVVYQNQFSNFLREVIMDAVTSSLKPVTGHNQLSQSTKLAGYGTRKSVSYEAQPTSDQESAKGIREVQRCQKPA